MSWKKGQGIDGETVRSVVESREKSEPDRYLQVCVKIHNFYRQLEEILVEKTKDAREAEGVRRCIGELRRIFREELRYAREKLG